MNSFHKFRFLSWPLVLFLSACAGSANHNVVDSHRPGDHSLSCREIDSEIIKTEVVIENVNKDKDDVSWADVTDAVLWFPFNLIAKSKNYGAALEAAGERIERLENLRREKDCEKRFYSGDGRANDDDRKMLIINNNNNDRENNYANDRYRDYGYSDEERANIKNSLSKELRELNSLYEDGEITPAEYRRAKAKLLDSY